MTRFEFKLKVNFIDEETGEEIYHKVLIDNSNGNEIGFDDMVGLLNEQQDTINNFEKLFSETIGVADTSKLLKTGDYEIKRMVVKELIENLQKENEQLKEELNNLKKDETMLYHYYTLARYRGDGV